MSEKTNKPVCVICEKPSVEDYKPFCSKRCADVDLNRWLKGGYAIPAEPASISDLNEKEEAEGKSLLH